MRVPAAHCLNCGEVLDAVTSTSDEEHVPRDGDFTICFSCAHLMVFAADSKLRNLTDAEIVSIAGRPELRRAMDMLKFVHEHFPRRGRDTKRDDDPTPRRN